MTDEQINVAGRRSQASHSKRNESPMNWTKDAPTVEGDFRWRGTGRKDNGKIAEVYHINGELFAHVDGYTDRVKTWGGEWCRLVPANEVEKAWREGWTEGFACDGQATYGFDGQQDMDFSKSRAKRVMEGRE